MNGSKGSTLEPLLFDKFLADLFFIVDDIRIASYADEDTSYVSGEDTEEVTESLEELQVMPINVTYL